jgi:hypothetical protein
MSKTVTIPTDGGNPFVVILGGVKYVYKPGETVEVPDGVALEIEEWERWHEKYYGENVPPFGAGGGGADWNQNDPNAADYVKNRPFYSIDEWGVVAKEQTVQINEEAYADLVVVSAMISEDETYIVTLNGTRYECVAWWYDGWSAMMLGNGAFADAEGMGEDVPFAIVFYPENDIAYFYAEEGTYTISIEGWMSGRKVIDRNFLPSDLIMRIANCKPSYTFSFDRVSLPSTVGNRGFVQNSRSQGFPTFLETYEWNEGSYVFEIGVGDKKVRNISAQIAKNANGYYTITALYVDNDTNGVYKLEEEQTADINTNGEMPFSAYITRII